MTDTRRALLQGLALAPLAGAVVVLAPTQATAAPGALRDLSTDALLERAARIDSDPAFRALCAGWLAAIQENRAAFAAWEAAIEAAEADAPPYPPGLCYCSRYACMYGPDKGRVIYRDERCNPDDAKASGFLWNLAHWRKDAAGVTYQEAEAQLRAEFAAWKDAHAAALRRHRVSDYHAATEGPQERERRAFEAVMGYRPRNADTLLTKMHLRASDNDFPRTADAWAAVIAEVESALAGAST